MSIQEKFEKAVNVIRNLPKNGSYQPSHELQLRFYAYYKQATEGINNQPKPSFWEVVKKAKWDAWTRLGNMTKEEAMVHYVQELRKIVETMSYTDNVAMFLNSLDNFYENVPVEDLEMLVGPVIEKIRSRPNSPLSGSPLASRDTSPTRVAGLSRDSSPLRLHPGTGAGVGGPKHVTSSLETSPASSYSASPLPPDSDEDEDHFLDTQTEPDRSSKKGRESSVTMESPSAQARVSSVSAAPLQVGKKNAGEPMMPSDPIVSALRQDMDNLINRLASIEGTIGTQTKQLNQRKDLCNGVNNTRDMDEGSTFKTAIENLTREMAMLNRRVSTLEKYLDRREEDGDSRGRVMRWWNLQTQTTVVLLAWPVLVLLISRWLAARRGR